MNTSVFVILRHTFREAVAQPIYSLLIALGGVILILFAALPFFTFGEDTVMYLSVGLDVVLLVVLVATLFATSRCIFEEIEDRTMLTLMSKPVRRWEVLIGKYLGIVMAALLAVAVLGLIMGVCTLLRIPNDYTLRPNTVDDTEWQRLVDTRNMHLWGLGASLILVWLQVAALAAIGVALSTRVSLVVNMPVVILIYIAGNLARFLYPLDMGPLAHAPTLVKGLAYVVGLLLPTLELFDLKPVTVHGKLAIGYFAEYPHSFSLNAVWGFVALAGGYALAYATFALSAGMWLFRRRELGGAA